MFLHVAVQGRAGEILSTDTDQRNDLAKFLRPMHQLTSAFLKSKSPGVSTTDANGPERQSACLSLIYKMLCKPNSSFIAAFPNFGLFEEMIKSLMSRATKVLHDRQSVYDNDARETVEKLQNSLKTIPQVKPADMEPFVTQAKAVSKVLLSSTDLAFEIIGSVESDAAAFGCNTSNICEQYTETWVILLI